MPERIPIACSLDQLDLDDRVRLLAELGQSLSAVEADGREASLRFDSGGEALEDFVRAESACCPFFDFALDREPHSTTLRVAVPEGGEPAVRALVAGFVAGWRALA